MSKCKSGKERKNPHTHVRMFAAKKNSFTNIMWDCKEGDSEVSTKQGRVSGNSSPHY